jgi:hypothetical protein
MKINDWYDFTKFRSNELVTLKFFKDDPYLQEDFPALATQAYVSYYQLASTALPFNFESELEIQIDGKQGKIHIGVQSFYDNSKNFIGQSYYMAICEAKPPRHRLLRKYHFDYILPETYRRQPHPIFHLQYAGELSPHLQNLNLEHDHIDSWLSEPRLFFMPMSLALLVNIILKEFPDDRTEKIIERREWRDLIRKNENSLLVPYYRCCNLFLSGNKPDQLFTNDFCYGN